MAARDLCTLDDVTDYAPGYTSDTETDDKLQALITAESRSWHQHTKREFIAITPSVDPRSFEIRSTEQRVIRIGDCATITTLQLLDLDQTTVVQTLTVPAYVALPRVREDWEPITRIELPWFTTGAAMLLPGQLLRVTGTWGFPAVPADVVEAVAKLVIVRYLGDVADTGTLFAEAADLNPGAMFRATMDVRDSYAAFPPQKR